MKSKSASARYRRLGIGTAGIAALVSLAACSSPSSSAADPAASAAAPSTAAPSATEAYSGPEASLPVGYPKPTKKAGFTFTIGFPIPSSSVPELAAEAAGAKAATEALGGKFVSLDANFSVQQQVSDFDQLLNEHVSAIVLSALDPSSLTPELKKAAAQNVPVFVNDVPDSAGASTSGDGFTGDILSGTDKGAFENAQAIAKADPGASFGIVGVNIPSPFLQYIASADKTWAEKFGLKYAGSLLASADSVSAGLTTGGELLAKYPNVKVIFTVTDSLAEGTASAAAVAGRDVKILSMGGYTSAISEINEGKIFSTWGVDSYAMGENWVYGAYDELTKQHLPLAAQVTTPGDKLLTAGNTTGFQATNG